jgi:hypothetical protein
LGAGMKRNIYFVFLALITLSFILAGCATTTIRFNSKYLPDANAEKPLERFDFNTSQNQMIKRYLNAPKTLNDAALFWFGGQKIVLNLEGVEMLSIDAANQRITELADEEKKHIAKELSQKVNITNEVTQKGAISQILKSVFSYGGQRYTGEISFGEPPPLKVALETQQTLSEDNPKAAVCITAKIIGEFTDTEGNTVPIDWDCPCEWMPRAIADIKIPQQLRKIQMAPSADHIVFENILYAIKAAGKKEKLFESTSSIVSSAINPDWTRIAFLRGKDGNYWIDLFEISVIN